MNFSNASPTHFPFKFVYCVYSIKVCPVISFFVIALNCIASSAPMQLWPYKCLCMLFKCIMWCFLKFMHLHHCISSRYARYTTRGITGQSGAEPKDGVMVDQSRRWKDCLEYMIGLEMLSSWCKLTNWLCVKPQASPRA